MTRMSVIQPSKPINIHFEHVLQNALAEMPFSLYPRKKKTFKNPSTASKHFILHLYTLPLSFKPLVVTHLSDIFLLLI